MKRRLATACLALGPWLGAPHVRAQTPVEVFTYPRSESPSDSQYVYDYELLRLALEATVPTHGPFELRASAQAMNQAKAGEEILAGTRSVNVFARSTSAEIEMRFLPVRIPIDKGLISWRVFLVRADMEAKFAEVESLDQLRAYSVGSFTTWADTSILRAAGFKVVTGDSYEGLFRMLVDRKFDFFSRSADEAYREWDERRARLPEMRVEQKLLLHFPTTRYFFVRRADEGQRLAERIEAGLETLIRTASFDNYFLRYKAVLINRAHLKTRRPFYIDNPFASRETRALVKSRPELWFDVAKAR
ncbi:hypothetical protein [Ramlibacter sp. PS4R-6]|uniref:hypothetical protein n=1 Tax=Ramlibacter sp. PS4R-6 TaxID=3133438 RepID=UPI0030B6AB5A